MKTGILLFVFGFMVVFAKGSETKSNAITFCLELSGNISTKNENENDYYFVELITDNKVIQLLKVKDGRSFKFLLTKDRWYALRILKKGYITKTISVSTHLPKGKETLYRFHFDTDLIPETQAKVLDQEALDFPIAIVSFDKDAEWFYYNEEFTANMKRQIYKRAFSDKPDQFSTNHCLKNHTQ